MGVRRAADLPGGRVQRERERGLGDEVGGVRPDDVDAERVLRLGVGDDLGEALVLAADDRLGDRLERDLADLVRDAGGLHLLLGLADGRDLGPAVGRPWLRVVVEVVDVGVAGDRVRGRQALVAGRVGQPQAADDVADRVDMRLLRAHPAVHLDDAPIGLDRRGLEADVLDVRGAAGRDEHHLGAELRRVLALGTDQQADAVVVGRDGLRIETGVGHHRDAALGELALDELAHLAVLERHDPGQVLEHGHLDPDVVEHRRELDADRAGPDDHDVLGQGVHLEDVVARDDALAVRGRGPGSDFTREPVARMTSVACRTRSPPLPGVPSSPGCTTRIFCGPSRRPRPAIQVTLFLSMSVLRPVHIRFTTASRLAAIAT